MKKITTSIKNYFHFTDKILISLCLATSGYSCLLLYGLYNGEKITLRAIAIQAIATLIGLIAIIIISKIDYELIGRLWKFHLPLAYFLTLLTFTPLGVQRAEWIDDRAWLKLPVIGGFQPAELLKISFIVTFAYHLFKVGDKINKPKFLIPLCVNGAAPVLLAHFQGDDGTALVFLIIFVFMIFKAGISWKYIGFAGICGAIIVPITWFFLLSDEKKDRILAVYNPDMSSNAIRWQQYMGEIAIGSGSMSGKGLHYQAYQAVPEVKNDFIFSFVGEAFGFLGCMFMLFLIGAICFRIINTFRISEDEFAQNICIGVFAMYAGQCIINIGMNLSLIPVIGITLPFMSAGGTSVVTTYMGIGLVLSIYLKTKSNVFLEDK